MRAQTQVLIITGLGGEARFTNRFDSLAMRLSSALATRYRIPDSAITWLGEDASCPDAHFRGRSTREHVEKAVDAMAARARPGQQVVFVLIGHGGGEGAESRLDIPGPDLTAADYARLLGKFPQQGVAFLALASGIGDMLPLVSAPNRVIITATKTGYERNESHFAEFFVDALTRDVADVDKDGRVSLLEAYTYAARETRRLYDDAAKLQTEHSQLDDQGAGVGEPAPSGRSGQGMLARRFFLDSRMAAANVAGADPALAARYAEKFAIEDSLETLRQRKPAMTADAYDAELERILVALARKSREIRQMEAKP